MGRRRYRTTGARSTMRSDGCHAFGWLPSGRHTRGCVPATDAWVAAQSQTVAGVQQRGAKFARMLQIHRGRFVQKRQNVDNTRRLPMRINDPCGNRPLRRTTAGVTVLGCALFLASCDERPFSSPAPAGGVKAQTVSAGPFTFENFPLGAVPGTVCPGSSACTNGAAEPAIRADNTGTFYVSSELGLSAGTLAW